MFHLTSSQFGRRGGRAERTVLQREVYAIKDAAPSAASPESVVLARSGSRVRGDVPERPDVELPGGGAGVEVQPEGDGVPIGRRWDYWR